MNDLLKFLVRNTRWFLFLGYVVISLILLFESNPYQHHLYLTSANSVSATVYEAANNVTGYFNLRDINDDLNRRNADLQLEVIGLREQLRAMHETLTHDSLVNDDWMNLTSQQYEFIVATVINNSVSRPHNYLTINKGSEDGIKPEMGVIDQGGVVGIVNVTGPHSARVISLLNPILQVSCKIKGDDSFGSLVWDGKDPRVAILQELPRYAKYNPGDTVVTTGYSAVFPAGIPVGVVLPDQGSQNDNFFTLRIGLFADFTKLSTVQVVINKQRDELVKLTEGEEQ